MPRRFFEAVSPYEDPNWSLNRIIPERFYCIAGSVLRSLLLVSREV